MLLQQRTARRLGRTQELTGAFQANGKTTVRTIDVWLNIYVHVWYVSKYTRTHGFPVSACTPGGRRNF